MHNEESNAVGEPYLPLMSKVYICVYKVNKKAIHSSMSH